MLEQFEMPHERTFPPRVDTGNLVAQYDVLILPSGVLPDPDRPAARGGDLPESANDSIEAMLPPEYRN